MTQTGIVLLVLGVLVWPVAFVAAVLGFGTVASAAFDAAKGLSPLLLTLGVVLVIVGPAVKRSRAVG
jgi:uncharacterized membrane protein YtjA (UPF0391 family)